MFSKVSLALLILLSLKVISYANAEGITLIQQKNHKANNNGLVIPYTTTAPLGSGLYPDTTPTEASTLYGLGTTNKKSPSFKLSWLDEGSGWMDMNNMCVRSNNFASDLTKLQNATNWLSCFPEASKDGTDKDLFSQDFNTCGCLKDSKVSDVKSIMAVGGAAIDKIASAEVKEKIQNEAKKVLEKEISKASTGIAFQSFNISKSTLYTSATFMSTMQALGVNVTTASGGKTAVDGGGLSKLMDMAITEINRAKMGSFMPSEQQLKENPLFTPQYPYPDGVCISQQDFFLIKENDSTTKLSELNQDSLVTYKKADWSYLALQEKYRKLMQLPPVERIKAKNEILKTKSKLSFLNRNPMIKYAMDGLEDEKNEKLFQILKETFGKAPGKKDDCLDAFGECRKTYNSKLAMFFSNPDVLNTIKMRTQTDILNKAQSKTDLLSAMLKGDNKKALYSDGVIKRDLLLKNFQNTYKLGNPSDCNSFSLNASDCVYTYAAYCKTLDKFKTDIQKIPDLDKELADNLEDQLNDDFKLNSKEYRQFNQELCQKRRAKNGKVGGPSSTFDEFVNQYCSTKSENVGCGKENAEDYAILRKKYTEEYPLSSESLEQVSKIAGNSTGSKKTLEDIFNGKTGGGMSSKDSKDFFSNVTNRSSSPSELLASYTKNIVDKIATKSEAVTSSLGALADKSNGTTSHVKETTSTLAEPMWTQNYSNQAAKPMAAQNETSKVESISDIQKRDLLDDWKKDFEAMKSKKDEKQETVASANESVMKSRIEALETLLAQQKKLTEEQYRLLNEGIAERNKKATEQVVAENDDEVSVSRRKVKSSVDDSIADLDESVMRGPASVSDNGPRTTSGSEGGSIASIGRSISSASRAASDSGRESVDREEAKLVQFRENTNGTITIESAAGTSTSGNAISVPVTDELYRMAQSNPVGFNLSQIEQMIPKDQISKLESKGDYFVLLLQNGSKPPLEVKVKKDKSGLVQVANSQIVQRKVSLVTLRNTLRQ